MLCSEYREESSWHGFRPDLLKSALQKYVRRAEVEKAIWVGLELDQFRESPERGESIRTNMIHRMMIIFLEDIGPGGIEYWEIIDQQIDFLLNERKSESRSAAKERQAVTNLCGWMAQMYHCRELEHLELLTRSDASLKFLLNSQFPNLLPEFRPQISERKTYPNAGESALKVEIDCFWTEILHRRLFSFHWCKKIVTHARKASIRMKTRYGCRKPEYLIFEILQTAGEVLLDEFDLKQFQVYFRLGLKWFKEINTSEEFLTYFMLLHLLIYPESLRRIPMEINPMLVPNNSEPIQIDDYAYDLHTSEGRALGKNLLDFALEGAKVEHSWPGTLSEFHRLYTHNLIMKAIGRAQYSHFVSKS